MDPTLTPGIFSANQQLGPTPTPQQIQAAYAQANTMKGQGLTTEPVHAWTQGVNQMLKALLGNSQGQKADALQRQLNAAQAEAIPGAQQSQTPFIPPVPSAVQMPPPMAAPTYNGVSPGGIGGQ